MNFTKKVTTALLLILIAAAGPLDWSIFFGDVSAGSNLSSFLWQVLRIDVGLFL